MTSRWQAEKKAVVEAAQRMEKLRLTTGTGGNVSVRLQKQGSRELVAITPSGVAYAGMREADIAVMDFDLEQIEGELTPSTESPMHVGIYQARPDVNAIVHTHSVFATVAAVTGMEIPPLTDEMVVSVGGAIKVSEYTFPGTQELADNMCRALGERNAAIIRNHGAVGVGQNLDKALDVCALTEHVAQIFVYSSLLGKAQTLPEEVVKAEAAIYRMRRQTAAM